MSLLLALACTGAPADTADAPPYVPCGDGLCGGDESADACPTDCGVRNLMIADLSYPEGGETPGPDIDAVALVRGTQTRWAEAVVAWATFSPDNRWTDPTAVLGAPDSDCETKGFAALGGGYVIVSFGDWTVRNGDKVEIYEIGEAMCPGTGSRNDPWEASAGNGAAPTELVWLGTGWGRAALDVDGL